jgi:transcriptional regulator GlxA family with amidase domain
LQKSWNERSVTNVLITFKRPLQVLELLAADLKDELPVEQLSAALNLSTSRLRHLFHEQLGMSPAQVLKSLRLQAAKDLLSSTFQRAKEVMTAVRLNDASHFARDFREVYGISPSDLRKKSDITLKHVAKHDAHKAQRATA